MPSLGFGEILIILVLALLIFGPRRLPEMGRQIGRSLREFRQTAADLRAEIEEDLDDEPPPASRSSTRTRPSAGKASGASPRKASGTSPRKASGASPRKASGTSRRKASGASPHESPGSADGPPETPNGEVGPV